jgi:hypothetical protein
MSINFENPEIQTILQNNAIEQHYSLDRMPTKLVDPSTRVVKPKKPVCQNSHIQDISEIRK